MKVNKNLSGGAVQKVSMEFMHFEAFLQQEMVLLKSSGFEDEIIGNLTAYIQHRIDHIRQYPTTGVELKRAIIRLQRYVCHQSDLMVRILQSEQKKKYFVLSLVGMDTISTNIVAVNVFNSIGIGASASIGGAIVSDSFKHLFDEVWRN